MAWCRSVWYLLCPDTPQESYLPIVFSVIVLMAIITTLMTPPLLSYLLKKHVDNH
ncbi:hypothetical protein [Methylotuvimicrobium sp. KM1]|uniref:hypothetical protein n=1 Tax=Methylotuvimicrobium sp. KM1 TaxID=3377707 RepID=UPI00384F7A70